jgi:hypothetical protein
MGTQVETALVALAALAAAPWLIAAGMLLSGRWKLSTATEAARGKSAVPKREPEKPAATEAFQTVPAPANGSESVVGAP